MLTLEEYKMLLINTYRYEIDNNDAKRKERSISLSKQYGDSYLQKIITDTYEFINDIFSQDTINNGYCSFPLAENTTSYISLNLVGGYYSDTLFTVLNNKIISESILENIFGKKFYIEVEEEEIDFETNDEDIISFDCIYSLYMQGFPDNMQEIKEKLFGKSKLLNKNNS